MLALDNLLHAGCYHALLAVRSVVGHDNHLVRSFSHVVLHDDEVLSASCQHGDYPVSSVVKRCKDGQDGSDTDATSGANHCSKLLDF